MIVLFCPDFDSLPIFFCSLLCFLLYWTTRLLWIQKNTMKKNGKVKWTQSSGNVDDSWCFVIYSNYFILFFCRLLFMDAFWLLSLMNVVGGFAWKSGIFYPLWRHAIVLRLSLFERFIVIFTSITALSLFLDMKWIFCKGNIFKQFKKSSVVIFCKGLSDCRCFKNCLNKTTKVQVL